MYRLITPLPSEARAYTAVHTYNCRTRHYKRVRCTVGSPWASQLSSFSAASFFLFLSLSQHASRSKHNSRIRRIEHQWWCLIMSKITGRTVCTSISIRVTTVIRIKCINSLTFFSKPECRYYKKKHGI